MALTVWSTSKILAVTLVKCNVGTETRVLTEDGAYYDLKIRGIGTNGGLSCELRVISTVTFCPNR